jgi:hypothetical protein
MEYINNCNNRVALYCDDPMTQDMSGRHIDCTLNQLGPGQCAVTRFDLTTRRHESFQGSLQASHDALQAELGQAAPECPSTQVEEPDGLTEAPELGDVLNWIEAEIKLEAKAKATAKTEIVDGFLAQMAGTPEGATEQPETEGTGVQDEAKPEEDENAFPGLAPALRHIAARYPKFFEASRRESDFSGIAVPTGWIPYLEDALGILECSGISVSVTAFRLHLGALHVYSSRYETASLSVNLLDSLLAVTREVCPICGKRVPDEEICRNIEDGPGFCRACLKDGKLALSSPITGEEGADMGDMGI